MSITLGYNSPSFNSVFETGLNNQNQMAVRVTAPSTGIQVTDLYAYFGGYLQTTAAKLCIWNDDTTKTLNTASSTFTAGSFGLTIGGQTWQHAIVAANFSAGVNFWIGWWRDHNASQVWSEQTSGSTVEWLMTDTSSGPVALGTSNSAGSGIPGIYCVGVSEGGIKVWNGTSWVKHPTKTASDGVWHPCKTWDGSAWQRRG